MLIKQDTFVCPKYPTLYVTRTRTNGANIDPSHPQIAQARKDKIFIGQINSLIVYDFAHLAYNLFGHNSFNHITVTTTLRQSWLKDHLQELIRAWFSYDTIQDPVPEWSCGIH